MQSVDEFVKYAISKDVEHNDDFWQRLEEIINNDDLKRKFVEAFIRLSPSFNKENIMAVIGLINDIVISLEVSLPELYHLILDLMYRDYSYNYSLCHRFANLLIKLKPSEREVVFSDIIYLMNKKGILGIRTSICALYGNFDFDDIRSDLVNTYLDKVYDCLKANPNDEYLKKDIKNFLINRLKDSSYKTYVNRLEIFLAN